MAKRRKPRANEGNNWHHRKAKVNGGSGKISSGNMIEVDVLKHRAFHLLFGTKNTEQIAAILNKTWIDPAYELVVRKRNEIPRTETPTAQKGA
jgi:hypothetical protein